MSTQLEALKEQMSTCGSCDLCHGRTQVVFGEGHNSPLIMIIGEAPGEQEDKLGVPFIGPAGDKLNSILKYLELERKDIYITNSVLCRPPGNRNPTQTELEACHWRLDLQIQLLKPKLVVLLGKIALQQLTGKPVKGALNQYFYDKLKDHDDGFLTYKVGDHETKVIVSYHPSYHLRSPEIAYRATLPHWQKIKKWIDDNKNTSQDS